MRKERKLLTVLYIFVEKCKIIYMSGFDSLAAILRTHKVSFYQLAIVQSVIQQ